MYNANSRQTKINILQYRGSKIVKGVHLKSNWTHTEYRVSSSIKIPHIVVTVGWIVIKFFLHI